MAEFLSDFSSNKTKWHNWQIIKPLTLEVSQITGVDPVKITKIAGHESGRFFNPHQKVTGTVYGIAQFTDDTWYDSVSNIL